MEKILHGNSCYYGTSTDNTRLTFIYAKKFKINIMLVILIIIINNFSSGLKYILQISTMKNL